MMVDENTSCSQESNFIGYSSIDTCIEDWTDCYDSQTCIDEVIDQISSWWPVFPEAQDLPSVISYIERNLFFNSINRVLSSRFYGNNVLIL